MSIRFRGIGYDPVREGAMRLAEAKDLVLRLIMVGQSDAAWSLLISPASPDSDPEKFLIDGKVARAIHRFSGWHVPINPGWFSGGYDQPVINGTACWSCRSVRAQVLPVAGSVPESVVNASSLVFQGWADDLD
jgi:hypothetical protein